MLLITRHLSFLILDFTCSLFESYVQSYVSYMGHYINTAVLRMMVRLCVVTLAWQADCVKIIINTKHVITQEREKHFIFVW